MHTHAHDGDKHSTNSGCGYAADKHPNKKLCNLLISNAFIVIILHYPDQVVGLECLDTT